MCRRHGLFTASFVCVSNHTHSQVDSLNYHSFADKLTGFDGLAFARCFKCSPGPVLLKITLTNRLAEDNLTILTNSRDQVKLRSKQFVCRMQGSFNM